MLVDHHVQPSTYFLLAELGSYDMILGRKWLAAHDVLADCRRNRLYWPEDHQVDQWDVRRRERRIEQQRQKDLWNQKFGRRLEEGKTKVLRRRPSQPKTSLL